MPLNQKLQVKRVAGSVSAKLNSGAHDCCFVFAQGIALLGEITRTRPHMPDPFNILSYWRSSAMLETGINALLVSLDKRGSSFLQQVYQFLYK